MITLNGTNIFTLLGILPMDNPLAGHLDLPKRKGLINHDWGTEIEPFTDTEDIEFDGRVITFRGLIDGNITARLAAIRVLLLTGVQVLAWDTGTANVYFVDEMKVERFNDNFVTLIIPFSEPVVTIPTAPGSATGEGGFMIEGYNFFNDFGMIISEVEGLDTIPTRIDVKTTDTYLGVQYRQPGAITIKGYMTGTDIEKFNSLIAAAGLKTFQMPNGTAYEVYCTDGTQVVDSMFTVIMKRA